MRHFSCQGSRLDGTQGAAYGQWHGRPGIWGQGTASTTEDTTHAYSFRVAPGAAGLVALSALPALASDGLDTGDTADPCHGAGPFMTLPGLALFYAGLVQAKNVVSVLMHYFAIARLMSVMWVIAASLAFSGDGAWFGSLDNMFLAGIARQHVGTIPNASRPSR